ncbi:THAP domain-containing protein 1-like isoform X1 [Pimephales promelas]|uniref:THAP domain-containing protein 1-like isoform X1 n=2 Tax=Pimephales promelas TaxID=90988 RepID=UPI001955DABE|nr:THAP domain-containing protein 1-like isoform X1 [Pimephales promelas]
MLTAFDGLLANGGPHWRNAYWVLDYSLSANMSCCVAYKCSKRQVSSSGLSFFRFPFNDKERLQKWIRNVKRKGWTPNKYSRLCSLHFTPDCIITDMERNRLKPDAVPTIFYPHCQVKVEVRHTRVSVSENTTVREDDFDTKVDIRRNFSLDHDYNSGTHYEPQTAEIGEAGSSHSADHGAYTLKDSLSPLKRKLSDAESCLLSCKKQLKLQEQRVRRLKQKVKSLSLQLSMI